MKGRVVGDYVIDSLIGRGGMGSVYRGYHQNSNKEVAIKLLEPILADNKHFRERFRQEAFVMEKLNHPNIVAFYDYIEQEEDVFLVMEYVEGITLDKIIEKQGKISEARAKELLVQMSNALAYAHSQGIIHRDIKPSNFIINLETNKLKVLDFGIAKMLGENAQQLTKTGIQMGSILFMSPEQVKAEKDITHRTDIYSMGFTYYFMLTGTHPLQHYSSEYSIYEAIVSKNVIDFNKLKNFSKVTNEIIHRCLQKNPKERFATTLEIISLLKSEKVEENVSEKSLDSSKKRVLKKWIFSIMFITTLLMIVFIFLHNYNSREQKNNFSLHIQTAIYPNGGVDGFKSEVLKNVKYPSNKVLRCKTLVSFEVDEYGNLSDIKIIRRNLLECDKVVIEAVSKANSKWIPAKDSITGKTIKTRKYLNIDL